MPSLSINQDTIDKTQLRVQVNAPKPLTTESLTLAPLEDFDLPDSPNESFYIRKNLIFWKNTQ